MERWSNSSARIAIAAAVLLCLYGAATGEMVIVFTKAATICMECIGLD